MIVIVSDANILIDLLQIELFQGFLKINWEKHLPPNVIDEVREDNSNQLFNAIDNDKLIPPKFSSDDLLEIQKLKIRYPPLSLADCSCLYLAENLPAILLTGERKLRNIATGVHKLEVHGILWVIEKLIEDKIVTYRSAHEKLTQLIRINDRLPKNECDRYLRHWKKNFEPPKPSKPPIRKIRIGTRKKLI